MAKALTFDTGLVDYEINGVPVRFNPTDENFVSKFMGVFDELEKMQDAFVDATDFSAFGNLDKDMRAVLDGLLGDGKSDELFGDMNCYALADGLPVWTNLALALMDEIHDAFEREFGKTDSRMKSYNKKYESVMAKYRKGGK